MGKGVSLEIIVQAEVEVPGGGYTRVWGVGTAFQKLGCGNSAPFQRNRVRPDTDFIGVATMKDPVAIHLQDINQWQIKFIQEVINANIDAEVTPLVILRNCPLIGDISISESRLHKKEINKVISYLGGKHVVQEPDNWDGE